MITRKVSIYRSVNSPSRSPDYQLLAISDSKLTKIRELLANLVEKDTRRVAYGGVSLLNRREEYWVRRIHQVSF